MQFIKIRFNKRIRKTRRITVFHEDGVRMTDFQMKCLEITTLAKTLMM